MFFFTYSHRPNVNKFWLTFLIIHYWHWIHFCCPDEVKKKDKIPGKIHSVAFKCFSCWVLIKTFILQYFFLFFLLVNWRTVLVLNIRFIAVSHTHSGQSSNWHLLAPETQQEKENHCFSHYISVYPYAYVQPPPPFSSPLSYNTYFPKSFFPLKV